MRLSLEGMMMACLFVGVLLATLAFYVILDTYANLLSSVAGAF